MKILVSIDNSDHSKNAVEDLTRGYWVPNTEVIVTTAVWAPFGFVAPSGPPEGAENLIKEAAESIKQNSFVSSVETKVLMGNPKEFVPKLATDLKADLLVVGSRKPALAKLLFGSTSHAIMLMAPCSVRIARGRQKKPAPTVLIGFDGSEFSHAAMETVFDRKWPHGTRFVVLNAVPTVADSAYENPHIFSDEELEKGRQRLLSIAQPQLEGAANELRTKVPQATVEARIIDGHPRDAIVAAATTYNADLIVLGTQGRNFSARIAIGSVSEAVASGAPCSVEIVKAPHGT